MLDCRRFLVAELWVSRKFRRHALRLLLTSCRGSSSSVAHSLGFALTSAAAALSKCHGVSLTVCPNMIFRSPGRLREF